MRAFRSFCLPLFIFIWFHLFWEKIEDFWEVIQNKSNKTRVSRDRCRWNNCNCSFFFDYCCRVVCSTWKTVHLSNIDWWRWFTWKKWMDRETGRRGVVDDFQIMLFTFHLCWFFFPSLKNFMIDFQWKFSLKNSKVCIGIFHPLEWKIGHLFNWMHEMYGSAQHPPPPPKFDGLFSFFHSSSLKLQFDYCSRTKWLKCLMNNKMKAKKRNSISWLAKSLFNITSKHLQWHFWSSYWIRCVCVSSVFVSTSPACSEQNHDNSIEIIPLIRLKHFTSNDETWGISRPSFRHSLSLFVCVCCFVLVQARLSGKTGKKTFLFELHCLRKSLSFLQECNQSEYKYSETDRMGKKRNGK